VFALCSSRLGVLLFFDHLILLTLLHFWWNSNYIIF